MIEFILARYNYWIVIALMMTGLYIVFARGNLVKTLIGLNLFQTSVFIFYITVGKVLGGTAPILIEDKKKDAGHGADAGHSADAAYGAEHGGTHTDGHGDLSISEVPRGMISERTGVPLAAHDTTGSASEHSSSAGDLHGAVGDEGGSHGAESLATQLTDSHGGGDYAQAADAAAEVLYSNPLPHVLILTAIVVGVATTAVGLSLAVRIREAYGTVEEDALEAMDNASMAVETAVS